jgi:hypothetical protein
LAFLTPPGPKPKARFMNLAPTLQWARHVLAVLRQPPAVVRERVGPHRLREKLGWLEDFAPDVEAWSECQAVVDVVVTAVNRRGIYRGAARAARAELPRPLGAGGRALARELVTFVARQARRTRPGERLPGSTEVLESCFGRFKQLERQQARGGFTSLLLSFGALLAETTADAIQKAMEHSRTSAIFAWCQEHLGITLFGQRKLAFAASATEDG